MFKKEKKKTMSIENNVSVYIWCCSFIFIGLRTCIGLTDTNEINSREEDEESNF